MDLRLLGWITALALTIGCSVIFKDDHTSARKDATPTGCLPACQPGQVCSAGGQCFCTPESCDLGCCGDDGLCRQPTVTSCGALGQSCRVCDAVFADSCSAGGDCACGPEAACEQGQRCTTGGCVCDSESCPDGCCNTEGECVDGDSPDECGNAGSACFDCQAAAAGDCQEGACSGCVLACAGTGCCAGNTCIPVSASDPTACNGTEGNACEACGIGADGCSPTGACACGTGPVCAADQECVSGECACSANSCPNGCCSDKMCIEADNEATCGTGGASCETCGANQRCDQDGDCVCEGLECSGVCCDDGSLVCDSAGACGCAQGQCGADECCDDSGTGDCLLMMPTIDGGMMCPA